MFSFSLFLVMAELSVGLTAQCGVLEANSPEIAVDSEALLHFNYTVPGLTYFHLQRKPAGSSNFQYVDRNIFEIATSGNRPLAVFKIHRSQYSDTGVYRVYCSAGSYSSEARLTIKAFPPSGPVFGKTVDLYGCLNCLPAWAGLSLVVTCSTWNGTDPVVMEIRKNNIRFNSMGISHPTAREMRGLVSFVPSVNDHLAELICLVKNTATERPLITSTKLYIQRSPENPVLSTTTYTEGRSANVTCSSTGGRPPPSVYFIHRGLPYYVKTNAMPINDVFFVENTLTLTFARTDNGNDITCCSEVSKEPPPVCTKSKISVWFPPTTTRLDKIQETSRGLEPTMTSRGSVVTVIALQCTVGESFPSSNIEWSGLGNIPHNISGSIFKQGSHGSVERVQTVSMQLSPADNRRGITCMASNRKFPHARPATTYILNVTYAPIITITPQENITLHAGDDVSIACNVDGNPPSTIAWYNDTGLIQMTYEGHTGTKSLYLDLYDVKANTSLAFTCTADNGVRAVQGKRITVNVIERASEKLEGSLDETNAGDITAVVICLLLLVVIVTTIVVVVLFRRRKRKYEMRPDTNGLQIRVEERQPSINPPVEGNQQKQQYMINHRTGPEPVYNNIKDMKELNDYAELHDNETCRGEQSSTEAQPELVYAELTLSDNGSPRCKPYIKLQPETEYVSIDFTKKAHNSGTMEDDHLE